MVEGAGLGGAQFLQDLLSTVANDAGWLVLGGCLDPGLPDLVLHWLFPHDDDSFHWIYEIDLGPKKLTWLVQGENALCQYSATLPSS